MIDGLALWGHEALSLTEAVTAAGVGVILNLVEFFGYQVLWPQGIDWPSH